jgi:hypothetical protein
VPEHAAAGGGYGNINRFALQNTPHWRWFNSALTFCEESHAWLQQFSMPLSFFRTGDPCVPVKALLPLHSHLWRTGLHAPCKQLAESSQQELATMGLCHMNVKLKGLNSRQNKGRQKRRISSIKLFDFTAEMQTLWKY